MGWVEGKLRSPYDALLTATYLDDISVESGAFCYAPKTHLFHYQEKDSRDRTNLSKEELDKRISAELASNSGRTMIVSYSNCSPSTQRAVDALNAKYGNVEWVQYDPVSFSASTA